MYQHLQRKHGSKHAPQCTVQSWFPRPLKNIDKTKPGQHSGRKLMSFLRNKKEFKYNYYRIQKKHDFRWKFLRNKLMKIIRLRRIHIYLKQYWKNNIKSHSPPNHRNYGQKLRYRQKPIKIPPNINFYPLMMP